MFLPHGEYRIELDNNVMLVEAKGPFNIEVVKQYSQQVAATLRQLVLLWGQVVILHQNSLFTPEAEQLMYKTVKDRKEHGLVASAVIINGSASQFIIEQQVAQIYQASKVSYRFFDDECEARAWVDGALTGYS